MKCKAFTLVRYNTALAKPHTSVFFLWLKLPLLVPCPVLLISLFLAKPSLAAYEQDSRPHCVSNTVTVRRTSYFFRSGNSISTQTIIASSSLWPAYEVRRIRSRLLRSETAARLFSEPWAIRKLAFLVPAQCQFARPTAHIGRLYLWKPVDQRYVVG